MLRSEADETLDHLHEVLDERFEAGPADYVIAHAIATSTGADTFAVEVVYSPTAGAETREIRVDELDGRTPLEIAWEIYRTLESGTPTDAV